MSLVLGSLFLAGWSCVNSAPSPVVTHSNILSYVDSFLVHVANHRSVYVPHRGVIEEVPSLPSPAYEAMSEIAEPIINSTVEAHHRSPIPCVENESRTAPAPIRWSPEVTNLRRQHPRARHPVVIIAVPGPVAGIPDIAIPRTNWLVVYGQLWRCNCDGNNHLPKSRGRDE